MTKQLCPTGLDRAGKTIAVCDKYAGHVGRHRSRRFGATSNDSEEAIEYTISWGKHILPVRAIKWLRSEAYWLLLRAERAIDDWKWRLFDRDTDGP